MLVYFPTLTTIKSCSESCRISLLDFTGKKDNKCNCGVQKANEMGSPGVFFIVFLLYYLPTKSNKFFNNKQRNEQTKKKKLLYSRNGS